MKINIECIAYAAVFILLSNDLHSISKNKNTKIHRTDVAIGKKAYFCHFYFDTSIQQFQYAEKWRCNAYIYRSKLLLSMGMNAHEPRILARLLNPFYVRLLTFFCLSSALPLVELLFIVALSTFNGFQAKKGYFMEEQERTFFPLCYSKSACIVSIQWMLSTFIHIVFRHRVN